MKLKPTPRKCDHCGKPDIAKPGGCVAFVNPHTRKPGYYHITCFRVVCKGTK